VSQVKKYSEISEQRQTAPLLKIYVPMTRETTSSLSSHSGVGDMEGGAMGSALGVLVGSVGVGCFDGICEGDPEVGVTEGI